MVDILLLDTEPEYRRRGLALEALQLMLGYATGTGELFNVGNNYSPPLRIPAKHLVTRITESNMPSIRLFEKLGFKITKRVQVFGEVEMRWDSTKRPVDSSHIE